MTITSKPHALITLLDVEAIAWCQYGAPAPEDTPYHRMAYPRAFIYTCCNSDGSITGCTNGPHKAQGDKKVLPSDHLGAALKVLCSKNSDVEKTLAECLSAFHEACAIPLLSRVEAVGTFKPSAKSAASIRPPSEFHLCEQCDGTFFDSGHKHGECEYHDENYAGVKRKREDGDAGLRICERCNKKFAEGVNDEHSCAYHTFPLQLNEQGDTWSTKAFGAPSPKDAL
ncbi:hypothetical protein QBC36DRAFT_309591 [Triangularia setosa]|uniref:C2H2-type domain-containing protein n=1 Tax=Triangularia setosa TaxID=2587417 RepID=A0AAN7A983_9PEZI|nr:hypothetical protein QBC36DRAFT_309591 [Podospora setosa]